ncbi:glycosyltransferase family 2 protein [Beggiatoa leptomitoformis]|uniref:Glycosyltransferase n=1 Tax=Beggiatoa leptomitoformis TaxID=288004 RepID=A0A2N9YAG5_9GAMM|nr:glycosyltransferase family 2 protein [Beggiatoa leptomitoformis]AUI67439.1 glycosyltransferase [Beggiatoa leptomitoformis]QGX03555.1 glycosyltransferase [Beggiatoa leptomitoformis]
MSINKDSAIAPRILVIIVTWNKQQYVLDLLASLTQQNYPTVFIDIVVVDNASQDNTVAEIKATYPQVHLICNSENVGGTGGFNTGLRWAYEQPDGHYDYLWLLDNDVLVHQNALVELVNILESHADIAVVGSTMMQLDYPWRINEMGAFVDFGSGQLKLNRHLEEVQAWQGQDIKVLLQQDYDLSKRLLHCHPYMDVDYVAAASLLIRAPIAKQAGLWRDYFIHFDDVEWCLRLGQMGHRVVVSAKSLIWHLSAAAKVPTWVLYYDNRNVLDMLKTHGADDATLRRMIQYSLKKAVYYHLLGKPDLAQLHYDAVDDFQQNQFGKKAIQLTVSQYKPNHSIASVLTDPTIKRVLISFAVNLQATDTQEIIASILKQRSDLQVVFMPLINGISVYQLPRSRFTPPIPRFFLRRWLFYWRLRGQYDLVIQSDYQRVIGLSWLKAKIIFINDEGFALSPPPNFSTVWQAGLRWFKSLF